MRLLAPFALTVLAAAAHAQPAPRTASPQPAPQGAPARGAPEPVAYGSEDPEAGGSWIPPELRELVGRLERTRARPSRVTWIGGSAGDCDELWRFRLIYGESGRFANLSAFRTREEARACAAQVRASHGAGPFLVVFTDTIEPAVRAEVVKALDALRFDAGTAVPEGALPAGANPGLYQPHHRRPPPPLHR